MENQIRRFDEGGINEVDVFEDYSTGTGLKPLDMTQFEETETTPSSDAVDLKGIAPSLDSGYLNLLTQALAPVDYETKSDQYKSRLQGLYEPPTKPSFYDLMSDLGAGIMSQPTTAGAFPGIAAGFNTFSARMKADRDERKKQRQAIALEAAKLAMDDERKAEERIREFAMELIQNQASGEADLITLTYDEMDENGQFTGKKITRSFDKKSQGKEIKRILANQNPVVVSDLPDPSPEGKLSEEDAKALSKQSTEIAAQEAQSYAALDNLSEAERLAGELGEKGFGATQELTLGFRQFFGQVAPWLGVDLDKVSKQEALATITIGFALANVSQTKGAVSNAEMNLFIKSAPFLGQTYEGFLRSIDIQRRVATKQQEYAREYQAELDRITREAGERGVTLTGTQARNAMNRWNSQWRAENRDSFLTEDDKKAIEKARNDAQAGGFRGDYSKFESKYQKFLRDTSSRNQRSVAASDQQSLRQRIENDPTLSDEQKAALFAQLDEVGQ